MFNHMYVISMFSFSYSYYKSRAVSGSCQPLCYTYWRFCSSWQSEFQNCSTETWRNILRYGAKHGECSVLVCTQEQDFFSKYKEKKLNIKWYVANWLTDFLTPWSRVLLEKLIFPWLTNKLSKFCWTQRFSMFAIASHMSLSWARSVQSMPAILFFEDRF